MGICHQCKEQTTIYCIDHDKHICLKCLANSHPTCTICQYNEYVEGSAKKDPNCQICEEEIFEGDRTARLPCLHKVHFDCFKHDIEAAEPTEDLVFSSKVVCPVCKKDVFDDNNIGNPLFVKLLEIFTENKFVEKFKEAKNLVTESSKVVKSENMGDKEQVEKNEAEEKNETTKVSLTTGEAEEVVETKESSKNIAKDNEVGIAMDEESTNLEIDVEDDDTKKTQIKKDFDGNLVLNATKVLIVVLVVAFIFVINMLNNQRKLGLAENKVN
ncbi:hypothetical protein EIN_274750 [Entamoeba invadens IP1]|uniref:RING-type domain-containing protein n=1 Tax=Entamoeba invadens IP1 TaxID=370355 RepID=A0A0A1U4S1_ENTIV|nr:hypothetical protein EIN_274750 [Entamoeba invadens IP1]ELP87888.1 hypothetical protein EIN_274750 [Entamoeba invadens IP1]|eukprot:XP_004254659.1 hypothetical protein EIN_274750 [Entamoeba invadens IP1]